MEPLTREYDDPPAEKENSDMPKAKRQQNCYICEEAGDIRMSFMVCAKCDRHFCSHHGDHKLDECTTCLEGGEET